MSDEWLIRFEQWLKDNEFFTFYGWEIIEQYEKFKKEGTESE